MHSTKPRNASGSRSTAGADRPCTAPNSTPVIAAAGHTPRQFLSARKTKPRNSSSSQIGATTQVTAQAARIPIVLPLPPRSLTRFFSAPVECSAANQA